MPVTHTLSRVSMAPTFLLRCSAWSVVCMLVRRLVRPPVLGIHLGGRRDASPAVWICHPGCRWWDGAWGRVIVRVLSRHRVITRKPPGPGGPRTARRPGAPQPPARRRGVTYKGEGLRSKEDKREDERVLPTKVAWRRKERDDSSPGGSRPFYTRVPRPAGRRTAPHGGTPENHTGSSPRGQPFSMPLVYPVAEHRRISSSVLPY